MKQYRYLLLFIYIFITTASYCNKDNYPEANRLSINTAKSIIKNSYNREQKEKAIKEIINYANDGYPEAMHTLGMAYSLGLGVKKDPLVAKIWFEKASELGYEKSDYNLANMYRRGIGVEQNFEKAYSYLQKVAATGNTQGEYGLAYLHYKGLGCEQSYEKAKEYFEKAAEKNHGHAMFMLGLCYRNGYGVEQNIPQGNVWLKKAAQNNIKADAELNSESSERPLKMKKLKSFSLSPNEFSATHKVVEHTLKDTENIAGKYVGTLITYDWSGKYILEENDLDVVITQNGKEITLSWQEENASYMEGRGLLTDHGLVFTEGSYFLKEHFHREDPREWKFLSATLSPTHGSNEIGLAGNIHLYNPETKEPGKPRYLILNSQQTTSISDKEDVNNSQFSIFPNPFTDHINIFFSLEKKTKCTIEIYSTTGTLLYQQPLGEIIQGTHRYQIPLNIPTGEYIVRLMRDDKMQTTIIVKQ